MELKRIGIMGGTFNPIHKGHIEIAKAAYQQYAMDKILFLPNKNPPHKQGKALAQNQERLDMVRLAICRYPYFELSTIEMEREGLSYTADTLRYLRQRYPDAKFYFIIGADSLHDMKQWRDPEVIFHMADILCAPRFPSTREDDKQCRRELMQQYKACIEFIHMNPIHAASRNILVDLKCGLDVSDVLPDAVYDYICQNHLYGLP